LNLGRASQAENDLTKAISLNPNNATLYKLRGDARATQGDRHEAVKDYDAAIKLQPDYAAAYNNRGIALSHTGNTRQAVKDLRKAQEVAETAPAVKPGIDPGGVIW
jgi:Flp pilus assembly protein TadD